VTSHQRFRDAIPNDQALLTATHKQSEQQALIVQDRVAKSSSTHGRISGTHRQFGYAALCPISRCFAVGPGLSAVCAPTVLHFQFSATPTHTAAPFAAAPTATTPDSAAMTLFRWLRLW
jgi:hypothetical protein